MPSVYPALIASSLALALSACASDTTNYPSLARRPIEKAGASEVVAPGRTASPAPASQQDTDRLAALVEQARTAHQRFLAKQQRAAQTVAAGSGSVQGSETWAVASVALAELESERSAAMVALADLDQIFAAASTEGRATAAISAARDEVSGWIGDEDAVLAGLRGKLGG
jgi:hypothetical protein